MARYSPEHKAQTRQKLTDAARRLFRERGFDSVSIDNLMQSAGMTRGAFYAHFQSKEALVQEVLRMEPGLLQRLREVDEDRQEASELLREYLDPDERADLIYCPLVSHPIDAIRGGPQRRALYADQVNGIIESLRDSGEGHDEAIVLTVLAIGAAILSSATVDESLADRIQEACRDEIARRSADEG